MTCAACDKPIIGVTEYVDDEGHVYCDECWLMLASVKSVNKYGELYKKLAKGNKV